MTWYNTTIRPTILVRTDEPHYFVEEFKALKDWGNANLPKHIADLVAENLDWYAENTLPPDTDDPELQGIVEIEKPHKMLRYSIRSGCVSVMIRQEEFHQIIG